MRANALRKHSPQRKCPKCKSAVILETGIMRCSKCNWSRTIHDVS